MTIQLTTIRQSIKKSKKIIQVKEKLEQTQLNT